MRLAALLLLLCGAARAQAVPRPVEIVEGSRRLSFMPPPGCEVLPEEAQAQIKSKGAPFKYGCRTPQRDMLVTVMMAASGSVGERGLVDFERGFKDSQFGAFPELQWLSRDVVKLNGGDWVQLRYREGPTPDKLVHNVYFTDWAGRFVVFTASVLASKYDSRKAEIERSAKTIELSIGVNAPVEGLKPDNSPREKVKL